MTIEQFQTWLKDSRRRALVMGVLNVTPDSFSDGGSFLSAERALEHASAMVAAGADVIDVGGESTRPGAQRVDDVEQLRRIVPVIGAIASRLPIVISVDTTRLAVARGAVDAGASVINDISAGREDAGMLAFAAKRGLAIILMHMVGQPATMQSAAAYTDVVSEVAAFLRERTGAAMKAGVAHERILVDPGIGFGKTATHNLQLLGRMSELAAIGQPLVIGTSRKSFIGAITGEGAPSDRMFGTAATIAWSIANGAAMVRVHDIEPMARVVRMIEAILLQKMPEKSKV